MHEVTGEVSVGGLVPGRLGVERLILGAWCKSQIAANILLGCDPPFCHTNQHGNAYTTLGQLALIKLTRSFKLTRIEITVIPYMRDNRIHVFTYKVVGRAGGIGAFRKALCKDHVYSFCQKHQNQIISQKNKHVNMKRNPTKRGKENHGYRTPSRIPVRASKPIDIKRKKR